MRQESLNVKLMDLTKEQEEVTILLGANLKRKELRRKKNVLKLKASVVVEAVSQTMLAAIKVKVVNLSGLVKAVNLYK